MMLSEKPHLRLSQVSCSGALFYSRLHTLKAEKWSNEMDFLKYSEINNITLTNRLQIFSPNDS